MTHARKSIVWATKNRVFFSLMNIHERGKEMLDTWDEWWWFKEEERRKKNKQHATVQSKLSVQIFWRILQIGRGFKTSLKCHPLWNLAGFSFCFGLARIIKLFFCFDSEKENKGTLMLRVHFSSFFKIYIQQNKKVFYLVLKKFGSHLSFALAPQRDSFLGLARENYFRFHVQTEPKKGQGLDQR